MRSLLSPHGVYSPEDVDAALARVFGAGVRPLHLEEVVFEAMLTGWASQQAARYLKPQDDQSERGGGPRVRRACRLLAVGVACFACGRVLRGSVGASATAGALDACAPTSSG